MAPGSEPKDEGIALIYDGQCPVCTAYSGWVDVAEDRSEGLRRVDARGNDALIGKATSAGLDLDQGMVVVYRGELYHGADALYMMARLAPSSGLRNRVNKFLFGSRTVTRLVYPILRAGRNTLLRLLGRKKIRNLGTSSQPRHE